MAIAGDKIDARYELTVNVDPNIGPFSQLVQIPWNTNSVALGAVGILISYGLMNLLLKLRGRRIGSRI